MARPKKDNADYFTHDSDMRNDPRIKALRRKFSFAGYSIWCYMLEVFTDSDHFHYEWNELNIELLAGDFDCDTKLLVEVVDYCIKLDLMQIDSENLISSYQHRKRFKSLLSKRKRDRNGVSVSDNPVIASENPQSRVKYSKVDKSKDLDKSISNSEFFKNNLKELANSKSWLESTLMSLRGTSDLKHVTGEFMATTLKDFIFEQQTLDGQHREIQDLKKHYVATVKQKWNHQNKF